LRLGFFSLADIADLDIVPTGRDILDANLTRPPPVLR
jgi:hypothetical protein